MKEQQEAKRPIQSLRPRTTSEDGQVCQPTRPDGGIPLFSSDLGHNVPYTSIQSMLKEYSGRLKAVRDPTKIISLPHTRRGRPLLLPADIDARVQKHLLAIRKSGGCVNQKIAIATALGTCRALQPSLLPEHGGSLTLEKGWAESIFRRMNSSSGKEPRPRKNYRTTSPKSSSVSCPVFAKRSRRTKFRQSWSST